MSKKDSGSAIIGTAYLIRLLRGLSAGWLGPLIPTIALAQAVSLVNVAFMFSVYFMGLFTMLVGGPFLLNRFGGKNCLFIASICYAVGFLTIGLGNGVIALWLGSLSIGFGAGISIPCGTLSVLKLSKNNAGSALSKYAILYGLGALIGPVLALCSQATPLSYRSVYLFGFVCALSIALYLFRLKDTPMIKDETDRTETMKLFKEPQLWFFALLLFLYIGVESSSAAWMFVYLKDSLNIDKTVASLGITALYIGLTIGRLMAVELCKKLSSSNLILCALIVSAMSFGCLIAKPENPFIALSLVFSLGVGFGPVFPNIVASCANKFPGSIGVTTSVLMICGVPGGMLFPWLTGMIGQESNMHSTVMSLLFMILVMVTLLLVNKRIGERTIAQSRQ